MRRPRVLLADDHQMLIDALKSVLEPRCEVVGSVTDGRSLLEAAEKLRPDVIVVDIAMPQLNGLDAGRKLQQKMPAVKLIFMTMNEDPYLVGEAFRAGASAFLLKQAAGFELVDASVTISASAHQLSARERHVLALRFVQDMTQTQIAEEIGVSQMQVSRILRRALARLREMTESGDELSGS